MNRSIYVVVFLITFSTLAFSQKAESKNEIIALVELVDVKHTVKNHNSAFFTFKIKEILSGELKDTIITSQEIYSGFGGAAILTKLYPENRTNKELKNQKADEVVIKFLPNPKDEVYESFILQWVAEKHRASSLESLEELLKRRGVKNYERFLLKENEGKVFFMENNINKIAVETNFGHWTVAVIEE